MPVKATTVIGKVKKKVRTPLKYSDILDMLGDSEENIQAALTDYYESPKGQQEILNSPQKGKRVEEVVEDLMKEVRMLKGKTHEQSKRP